MNETTMYDVKCDRCRKTIGTTGSLGTSAAGGTCGVCRLALEWLKGNFSQANVEATAKWAARTFPTVGGVRFFRETLKTAVGL
jgi:hypothetical protein